jgi:enamine deaminase RidA (YjgF/YER057c/UK114 family)
MYTREKENTMETQTAAETERLERKRALHLAGQAATDAGGRPLYAGDMYRQLHRAMDNVEAMLRQADYRVADIVRLNVYTTDVDALVANIDALMARLGTAGCRPASTLFGVSRLAFPELLVEIEATAVQG